MDKTITAYAKPLNKAEREICQLLATEIERHLPDAEGKVWHRHPFRFLDGNPVVGKVRNTSPRASHRVGASYASAMPSCSK